MAEHCFACHGDKKQESGLRLDTWEGIRDGGGSGRVLVPGHPERSLMMLAIGYQDTSLQMPPDGPLPPDAQKVLRQWIAWGAAHPDQPKTIGVPVRPASPPETLWAVQPLASPQLPEVRDTDWPRTEIDYFILARLESAGVSPALDADKVTWLRRVSFDLIGLPPTPAEVAAYLADRSPEAEGRVVERLLASPHYGERWGRHWLDVVRYADSNGSDENIAHGNAWRYRDYVIASLNDDVPFGQFVREQIAGDLLPYASPEERIRNLIATGFLSLGPKVLAEVDETKMEMDIIDEQIDTLGQAFLGMTLGCARCHDHKFDPITTRDYYALAGIFKSTRTMEHFKKIARWNENTIATPEQEQQRARAEQAVAAKKQELEARLAAARRELQAKLGDGAALPDKPEEQFSESAKQDLGRLREELKNLEAAVPELPTAMGVTEGTPTDVAVHLRGSHLSLGEVVPRGLPVALLQGPAPEIPATESGRAALAKWLSDPSNGLAYRVMANRVWRWHFGRGIVATPDNFGRLGERPSHPELLDWLAARLARTGSLKDLHRIIVLSRTYRMSSRADGRQRAQDPANQLFSRAPIQRLDAEVLRDSMLSVSGLLDTSMGGSMLHVKNREFFFDHTSKDTTSYDTTRRTVYLPVVRNHLYEVYELFDYSDAAVPNGNRSTTTVAPQALYLMNGDFVQRTAAALAARVIASADSAEPRVERLFQWVYSRPPDTDEIAACLGLLRDIQMQVDDERAAQSGDEGPAPETVAWQVLCHSLLMSNEFLYIR